MSTGKQPKTSEYPELMLRELVKAYDDENSPAFREEGIGFIDILQITGMTKKYADGDISTKEIYEYLRQLTTSGFIYEFSYSSDGPLYKPTLEGLQKGRFINHSMMRPWYQKTFDLIKGDVRTIVVSVITALITVIAIYFILRALD